MKLLAFALLLVVAVSTSIEPAKAATRIYTPSERAKKLIGTLYPHYSREWPLGDSVESKQEDAAYWHILNRYYATFAVISVIGDALQATLNIIPFIPGGVNHQDQVSGQGKDIHASHIVRARINKEMEEQNKDVYDVLVELTAITENMQREINLSHKFGGEIDFFSEQLMKPEDERMDWDNYRETFLECVKDIKNENLRHTTKTQSIVNAAQKVIDNWSDIEKTVKGKVQDIANGIKDFISKETDLRLNLNFDLLETNVNTGARRSVRIAQRSGNTK